MKKIMALAVGFIAAAAMTLVPQVANAHATKQYQGSDWVWTRDTDSSGTVHDGECDGNQAFALIWKKNGDTVRKNNTGGCGTTNSWDITGYAGFTWACEDQGANEPCGSSVLH